MKKKMTMLLAAAMVLSMSVSVNAAQAKYSISIDDDQLTLNNGETKVTYQLEESQIALSKSNAGGLALSFRTSKEEFKKLTLGEQKEIVISGEVDYVKLGSTLDRDFIIRFDKDSDIYKLESSGNAKIYTDGEIDKVYLTSNSARFTANDGSDVDIVYAKNTNGVKGLLSHHVKPYSEPKITVSSSGSSSSDSSKDNQKKDGWISYGYHNGVVSNSEFGLRNLRDNGSRIYFECDVAGASVYFNNIKIGTTEKGSNSFSVPKERDWTDELTVSKTGYRSDNVFLHNYNDNYSYVYRDGVRYWQANE